MKKFNVVVAEVGVSLGLQILKKSNAVITQPAFSQVDQVLPTGPGSGSGPPSQNDQKLLLAVTNPNPNPNPNPILTGRFCDGGPLKWRAVALAVND